MSDMVMRFKYDDVEHVVDMQQITAADAREWRTHTGEALLPAIAEAAGNDGAADPLTLFSLLLWLSGRQHGEPRDLTEIEQSVKLGSLVEIEMVEADDSPEG